MVVWLFEGVQPVEAERLLPVWPLHQRELAGVDLDLDWSCGGFVFFLLSPRAFHLAGGGIGKSRDSLKAKLGIPSWNKCMQETFRSP